MKVKGEWPHALTITRGWAKATARGWNSYRNDASMRLHRGSAQFTRQAAELVITAGADSVISPPLTVGPQQVWRDAGFEPFIRLQLLMRRLSRGQQPPEQSVVPVRNPEWSVLAEIDESGFGRHWCTSALGLEEAVRAAAMATVLQAQGPGPAPIGYAIVATSGPTGYLQRIAVARDGQGRGAGRSLVRASMLWAARKGARRMILNTKPDNARALDLYGSEGFTSMPDRLELLRFPPSP